MSALTCNGAPVLSGRITMPRVGVWSAELSVDTRFALNGSATIVSHGEALRLTGFVARGGMASDSALVRVVGGAGALDRDIAAAAYRALPIRVLLTDVLSAVGETLSPRSDAALLETVLPMWTRARGPAAHAVTALAEAMQATWRVLPDGAVWFGRDTWPEAAPFACDVIEENAEHGHVVLGVESHALVPGTTFLGRRVSLVVHTIDERGVRTEVWFEAEEESARFTSGFARLVRRLLWRVDYLALYPAIVVTQNADGSLEVKPESSRLPGLSRVPVRAGLPGVKVKVDAGARVLIGFEHGDPARPVATMWAEPGMTELQIGGTRPVARQGDQVTLTMPPVVPMTGSVTGPSGPMPFVGTIQIPTPLVGTIITGSGRLRA